MGTKAKRRNIMSVLQRGSIHRVSVSQVVEAKEVMAYVDDYNMGLLSESEFLHKLGFTSIPLSQYDKADANRLLIELD
jgi:hypothetical protein